MMIRLIWRCVYVIRAAIRYRQPACIAWRDSLVSIEDSSEYINDIEIWKQCGLGVLHSLRLSWAGVFGGSMTGKTYYVLWTIHVWDTPFKFDLTECDFHSLRPLNPLFYFHAKPKN